MFGTKKEEFKISVSEAILLKLALKQTLQIRVSVMQKITDEYVSMKQAELPASDTLGRELLAVKAQDLKQTVGSLKEGVKFANLMMSVAVALATVPEHEAAKNEYLAKFRETAVQYLGVLISPETRAKIKEMAAASHEMVIKDLVELGEKEADVRAFINRIANAG